MIEADGLTRAFGGRAVVQDVTFTVAPGEVVGFLGPNGAGKTTTIRLLLGVLRATAGTARLGGRAGYLPERFEPDGALTVLGYLRFSCRMKRLPLDAAEAALAATGAADLARRPIGRLSKGQRQRVALAQAVVGAPPVLVLDEPTVGLDPAQVVEARALLRQAADDGAAVLVSSHLLHEVAVGCDRAVVLVDGRVVADEPVTEDLEARYLSLVAGAVGTGSPR